MDVNYSIDELLYVIEICGKYPAKWRIIAADCVKACLEMKKRLEDDGR